MPGWLLLVVAAVQLLAGPSEAQEARRMRALRFEPAYSVNHDGKDTSVGGALRFVTSRPGNEALRFETGLIAGFPYLGADVGLEFRLPRRTRVGVVLRAGGGVLLEDGFIGPYGRGGGGLEWVLSRRIALRATGQAGIHGGQAGPHQFNLGLDYRW